MTQGPSHWRWLAALLTGIFFWYLALILGGITILLMGSNVQAPQGSALVIMILVRVLVVLGGIALAIRFVGLRLADLGLRFHHWREDLLVGLAVGILMPLLQFSLIIPNTGGAMRSDVIASRALIGDTIAGLSAAILAGWLAGGFAEELFFRGHLITTLRNLLGNQRWSLVAAVLLSTIYFAAGHRYQGWIGIVDTGMAALIWAGIYLWRGGLTPSIIAHGLNDMLLLIGLYLWY